MSWSFTEKGDGKEAVKAGVMNNQNVTEWKHCPVAVAEAICKIVDACHEPPNGSVLSVATNGHIGTAPSSGDVVNVAISYGPDTEAGS
jgi:hypothetical protein